MCVAAPGKILSINGTTATVAYSGNRVPANLGVVKAQVGDWVLVHAGLVIQVLSESQAQEMNDLLAELETLLRTCRTFAGRWPTTTVRP